MKNAILITDPLSSTEYLLNRFRQLDYSIIAVQTVKFKSEYVNNTWAVDELIISNGILANDFEAIQQLTKKYHILHGFTGVEANLCYAEKLLNLCFPNSSNDPTTSHLRSDKFMMNESLRLAQLNSIRQQKISSSLSPIEKCELTRDFFHNCSKNIVIKPNSESAASMGVLCPKNEEEIRFYYSKNNNFLFTESDYLIQERIHGDEYYADVVSYQGKYQLVSIGKYLKNLNAGSFEYCYADNCNLNDDLSIAAHEFIFKCLDILGMHNGLSHIEIMHTDSGFKLIELNPRVSGVHGFFNHMAYRQYGKDQVSVYAHLIQNMPIDLSLNNDVKQRLYIFKNKLKHNRAIDWSQLQSLHSCVDYKVLQKNETEIESSHQTLIDTVALILLEHQNKELIDQDTNRLDRLENYAVS